MTTEVMDKLSYKQSYIELFTFVKDVSDTSKHVCAGAEHECEQCEGMGGWDDPEVMDQYYTCWECEGRCLKCEADNLLASVPEVVEKPLFLKRIKNLLKNIKKSVDSF